MLLLLPGCSSINLSGDGGPGFKATVRSEKGAAAAAVPDAGELARWWKKAKDPVLDELVEEALRSSPDMRTALSRIRESRARRGMEQASLLPSVNAGISGQTSHTDDRGAGNSSTERYEGALDASWEVDLFGKQRLAVKAASADLAQTEENFYAAQVSLSAETALAYVDLRLAEAQLKVLEDSLKARAETVQIAGWKEQAGTGTALDALQARSTLEQARAAIPALKKQISQKHNQLALLCGHRPGELDSLLNSARPVPGVPAGLAATIPADTLRRRPDVRAAERGVEAAAARTKSAQRERWPSLNLSGSIGVDALKAGRLFSPDQTAASVLGSLTAPIFDGGRIRQNIAVQSEVEQQALITYESTVLKALSEVENALVEVRRSRERLGVLKNAAALAREAEVLARQRFEAGQQDILPVLEAQRTRLTLEDERVQAAAAEISGHIQLYKALGGGWSPL